MVKYLKCSRDGVVIGPTIDGGYYAIGLKAPRRRLFEDISWSTDRVFEQTKARIAELALPHITLPIWYDVDDEVALTRLFDHLCRKGQPRRSNSGYLANHTRRLLNRLFLTEIQVGLTSPDWSQIPKNLPGRPLSGYSPAR